MSSVFLSEILKQQKYNTTAFFMALPTVVTLAARWIHQGNVAKAYP